ncbi:MAG: polymerase, partial [Sphingomonas bacterium]|nr:polymerase [Sphingomonas bacterium]
TLPAPVGDIATIERVAVDLLASVEPVELGVRLLGVTLSNLSAPAGEAPLGMVDDQLPLGLFA